MGAMFLLTQPGGRWARVCLQGMRVLIDVPAGPAWRRINKTTRGQRGRHWSQRAE